MTVKERRLALKYLEKQKKQVEYASKLGVAVQVKNLGVMKKNQRMG